MVAMVVGTMALPAIASAAPLALPGYELVSFENGELQMLGFSGGDTQPTVGFYGTPSTPTPGDAPWQLVPTTPAAPADLFTEGGKCMLGITELAAMSEDTGNPEELFPMLLAFGLALLFGFAVYGATHVAKMGQRGSLFLQSITSLAVMVFFYVGGCHVIPGWVLIPFGIEALFFLIGRNPQHSST